MFKQFFRKGINLVDARNRPLGRIPPPVARALVTSNHAALLRNNPAIIGLRPPAKARVAHVNRTFANPLKNLVHTASLFASKSSRMTALNSILFKIVDGKLCVMATDLESRFIGYLECGANCSFANDGVSAVCLNANRLSKILASQDNNLNLHIEKGKDNPILRLGEFTIEGEDASEFPDMQFHKKGDKVCKYTITDITTKLNFVGQALSTNKYRPALCGIYFDFKNRQLAGADGDRLHSVSMADNERVNQNKDDIGVILPASLLRVSKLFTGNVTVVNNTEHQYAIFDLNVPGCMNCTGIYKAIEGQYPNYMDVIPKEGFISKFSVRAKDLLLSLHKAQIAIGNRDDKTMACEFKNGLLTVSIKRIERLIYQGAVRGEYRGPSYHSCINVDYLVDTLQTIPGDSVEILLQSGKDQAWTIQNSSGYKSIIMPIELES